MADDTGPRSLVLVLSEEGFVEEVAQGNPELIALELGRPFPEQFGDEAYTQAFELLGTLRSEGALFPCTLPASREPDTPELVCGGVVLEDDRALLVLAESTDALRRACKSLRTDVEFAPAAQRLLAHCRDGAERDCPGGAPVDELAGLYADLAELQREAERGREELERFAEERNRVLAMVAHDLRSPLNVIRLLAGLVAETTEDRLNDEERGHLVRIERSSAKMATMLEELLRASRFDLNPPKLNHAEADLVELVRRTLSVNAPVAARKDIQVELEESGPVKAQVDAERFDQIVDNLVNNAVKYSPPGTTVRIRVERDGRAAVVRVVDEGPGIPPDEIGKIFLPFSKTSVRPTNDEDSFGVGLAICRQLARAHGGELSVTSEVGRGSCFELRLPVERQRPGSRV